MIEFDITTKGIPAVMKTLDGLAGFETELGNIMGEWAKETLDDDLYGMTNYAPPLPNSTYVRTGNLGRNWGLRRGGKLSVVFQNPTDYAGWVVGDNDGGRQAAIHAGRWWIARKKVEDRVPALEVKIERHIDKLDRL